METGRRIISIDEIVKLTCGNAENVFSHNNTDDESRRFRYLLNGDIRAVDEADKLMLSIMLLRSVYLVAHVSVFLFVAGWWSAVCV